MKKYKKSTFEKTTSEELKKIYQEAIFELEHTIIEKDNDIRALQQAVNTLIHIPGVCHLCKRDVIKHQMICKQHLDLLYAEHLALLKSKKGFTWMKIKALFFRWK
jgi:hypothetical protein